MSKKHFLLSTVLYVVVFFGLTGEVLGDAAAQLERANAYVEDKNYDQAEAIYRAIVTDCPGTDEAFQAEKNLAVLYIKTGKYPAARQEVDTLLTDFADHPELPAEIYKLGDHYWDIGRYEDVKLLYEYIAENHCDSGFAIKARAWAAESDIKMGKDEAAQGGIDTLIKDFAEDPELSETLWKLGDYNWRSKKYNWAKRFYQHTFETDPQGPLAIKAKARMVESDIKLDNDAAAQAGIDALIKDFAEDPNLSETLWKLANDNLKRKEYNWSRQLYQHTFETDPQGPLAIKAKTGVVWADVMLGNDEAGQAGIDGLIADFADHPDLPAEIYNLGDPYWELKRYEDVQVLYDYIAENHPSSSFAIKARAWIAGADILLGNDAAAQAGIEALIRDFADDPELSGMLWKLGINTRNHEKYDWSQQLFQRSEDRSPDSSYAKRSRIWIIRNEIKLGGDPNVLAVVDDLIADFVDHPKLAGEVYALADDCRLLTRYEDARQLWQRVVDNFPDSNDVIVMKSRVGIIKADINLGDDPNVLGDVNELIADYKGQPGLCQAVFRIGEEYYSKASQMEKKGIKSESQDCLQKAVTVWERIIPLESRTSYPARACYFSGYAYLRMDDYGKAIECCEKVISTWPKCEYAWRALLRISKVYKLLMKEDVVSDSEGWAAVKVVYEQIVQEYPECAAAGEVRRWLERYGKSYEGGQK